MANATQLDAVRTKLQAALDGLALVQADAPGAGPLDTLALGYARALGPYSDPDPQFNTNGHSAKLIIEDNCLTYWANGDTLLFPEGAGHGLSQQTNPRGLSMKTAKWLNIFPSTPAVDMVKANIDKLYGRYKTTNEPTARHGYGLCPVVGDTLYVYAARGMPDTVNDLAPLASGGTTSMWGGASYKRDLRTGAVTYGNFFATQDYATPPTLPAGGVPMPWYFADQGAMHEPSGLFVVTGITGVNGSPSLWFVDLLTDTVKASMPISLPGFLAGAGWLVACGDDPDVFHLFNGGSYSTTPLHVAEIRVNTADIKKSTVTILSTLGLPPVMMWSLRTAMFWHPDAHCYIGCASFGCVYAFKPSTREWKTIPIKVESGSEWTFPPSMGFAPHDAGFHPPTKTLVFCQYEGGPYEQTWAYRFDPASFDATPITSATAFALGATRYATLMDAAAAAKSGDTITIDAGVYAGQAADFTGKTNLTFRCVAGRAVFVGGEASQKATFVVSDGCVFDGISGSAVHGSQGNDALIRLQGDNITVRNGEITDCSDGILTNPDHVGQGTVLLEDMLIRRCGDGSGQSHNLYIGKHASFVCNRVRSDDANVGHLFKSRAAITILTDCAGYEGRASRSVDACEGGVLIIGSTGAGKSWFKQDALTNNSSMVGYAMETKGVPTWPTNSVSIDADTVLYSSKPGGLPLQVLAGFTVTIDNQAKAGPDPAP